MVVSSNDMGASPTLNPILISRGVFPVGLPPAQERLQGALPLPPLGRLVATQACRGAANGDEFVARVRERTGLDRYQAYALLSVTGDLRVTQVVNGNKGIHLMLDKRYLTRSS